MRTYGLMVDMVYPIIGIIPYRSLKGQRVEDYSTTGIVSLTVER